MHRYVLLVLDDSKDLREKMRSIRLVLALAALLGLLSPAIAGFQVASLLRTRSDVSQAHTQDGRRVEGDLARASGEAGGNMRLRGGIEYYEERMDLSAAIRALKQVRLTGPLLAEKIPQRHVKRKHGSVFDCGN